MGRTWVWTSVVVLAVASAGAGAAKRTKSDVAATTAEATGPTTLPSQTSRYNRGDEPGRYRDEQGQIRLFKLRGTDATLFDGGGREIGTVRQPVKLNSGAFKTMKIGGRERTFGWAWATDAGLSGWIALDALVDPPAAKTDAERNVKPPGESDQLLTIDCAAGLKRLTGLKHPNSKGVIPTNGGNLGEHYAGRNPGPTDYVYLLFACPNVMRGGTAKDSLPDGSKFAAGLDENGKEIVEVMTMYRDGDWAKPMKVTFIYGRAEGGTLYGWIARANVGEL